MPVGEPIIGIPFYLAHAALAQLEKETHDLEDAREIMMYLRHEAGHAFTYAYKLHAKPEWKQMFGRFGGRIATTTGRLRFRATMCGICRDGMRRSIRMKILPRRSRVADARSNWRKRYRGWGAMAKLQYLNRLARKLARAILRGGADRPM